MNVVTCYPRTVSQTHSDSSQTKWINLNNLKNNSSSYAHTNLISSSKGKHPKVATLSCSNFGFNLPVGAEVIKIVVEYCHRKDKHDKYPTIAAPVLKLRNSGISAANNSKKGHVPTSEWKERSRGWNGEITAEKITGSITSMIKPIKNDTTANIYTTNNEIVSTEKVVYDHYDLPSRTRINSSDFGVDIRYPSNTSNPGYIDIKYVRITITYKEPNYSVKVKKTNKDPIFEGVPSEFQVTLNNLNLMSYATSVLITLPVDATVENLSGDWVGSSVTGNVITWSPPQGRARGSNTLIISAIFNEGSSQSITAVEQLKNATESVSFTVNPLQISFSEDYDDFDTNQIIYAKQNQEFTLPVTIPNVLLGGTGSIYVIIDKAMQIKRQGTNFTNVSANGSYIIPISAFDSNGACNLTCKTSTTGIINVGVSTSATVQDATFIVKVIPSSLTYPRFCIYQLSQEELNRLGDGYNYIVNSSLQINCDVANTGSFNDYYRNFRVGVVNHIEVTNDKFAIFDACNNFSSAMTLFNSYEEKTVEFTFNETYPVYIIVAGDYPVNDYFLAEFTPPVVMDADSYTNYDDTTYLPVPISNMIMEGENVAELMLCRLCSSNSIILYGFDFEEDFGTNDKIAIRGLQIDLDVEVESPVAVSAKIRSNKGIGERSIIINPNENTSNVLGGEFDTWGFNIAELTNLEDFEVELQFNNILHDATNEIIINNVELTSYFIKLRTNRVNAIVEGENMRWYGFYLQKATLNPGLKTKTKYAQVEGSDFNEAASMSIDKKEIELEFNVRGCTVEETTQLLQEIAKKLVNERDELDKPIPKRIEFSHIPDEHFDYILETPIDEDPKTMGYESKIKLTIPDGTSWANQDTVTNTTGVNEGITKVSPVISLVPFDRDIEIVESVHNQKFSMSLPDETSLSSVIQIDCESKKIYYIDTEDEDSESIDISAAADWDVDWFVLYPGAYNFESNGTCLIQSVIYTKRGA